MTTDVEIQAAVDGLVLDLQRLHDFMKGDATVDIVGEDGTYPSLAKWLSENGITADDVQGAIDAAAAAQGSAVTAQSAASAAQEARAAAGAYPESAATAVPRGVTTLTLGSGGSGYTDGTGFIGTFTGGGGSGARFKFDVAGGVVTSIYDLEPGYGYTSNPTPVFTASAGGTGATAASVSATHLVLSGQFYWVAQTNGSLRLYQNVGGVATAVAPAVYRPFPTVIGGTLSAVTSLLWNFAPATGLVVNGTAQSFQGVAPGNNGAGTLKVAIPGVFGGVATAVVTRTLDAVPAAWIKTGHMIRLTPVTVGGVNYLVLEDFNATPSVLRLEWMGPLTFNTGGVAILPGQTVTGATSGASAVVISVPDALATGDWGAGTKAGTIFTAAPAPGGTVATFTPGEDLKVGATTVAKVVAGVTANHVMYARVANPGENYPTGLLGVETHLQVPAAKPYGSPSLTVYAYDGVTSVYPASSIYDNLNAAIIQDAGAWEAWSILPLQRIAPSGRVNLMRTSEPALTVAFESVSAAALDIAPKNAPILLHRQTAKRWHVARSDGIANDTAAEQMNQNVHHALIYNMGDAISGVAELQNPNAWALNSEWADVEGRTFYYGMMASDELASGIFDQMQPSIAEPVAFLGFFGDAFNATFSGGPHNGKSKWTDIGIGHGNMKLVSASISGEAMANGNGAWTTVDLTSLAVGKRKRLRTLTFSAVYDIFIRIQTGYLCIGRLTLEHRFSHLWKGARLYARYDVGRSLAYTNYGPTVIAPGSVITGATSGATATVVIIPSTQIDSGTIAAGTAAGRMNIEAVTGTFVAGEDLLVGGVARAKAAGAQSTAIGVQQNYGWMLLGATINRAKANNGGAEVVVGLENGAEPTLGQGSRLQMRHANPAVEDVIYEEIQMDSTWTEAVLPMTGGYPAGQGAASGFWVQDRLLSTGGGLRKGYNSIYTGTGQNIFEGVKELFAQHQFRQGAML